MPDSSTETYMLADLVLDRVDLVTAGANPGASILIAKFESPDIVSGETVETPDVQPDEVDKQMADDVKVDTVDKADFEAVQKQLEELSKALEDARAEKAEASEQVAKMLHEQRQAEYVAKARDLSNLGEPEPLGALLLEVADKVDEPAYKQLEQLLKAANAQLEKGALFATFGKSDAEPAAEKSFDQKVDEMAKQMVADGKAKTVPLAKLEIMKSDPGLRAEYESARRA